MSRDFSPGDAVVIKTGRFAGQIGIVQRVNDGRPNRFAFVAVECGLTYGFDELEPSPSTAGIAAAYHRATNP